MIKTVCILLLIIPLSCSGRNNIEKSHQRDTIEAKSVGFEQGVDIVLEHDVDLMGKVCLIPPNITIKSGEGVIKNGILIGQQTKIVYKKAIFNNVEIEGTWDVPLIKTSMFKNLGYENSLKDVFALTNPLVNNCVIVEDGDYFVRIDKNGGNGIYICDKTDVVLEGAIHLVPNSHSSSDIIYIKGNNVSIKGGGTIIGDKYIHTGTTGEWGMGVRIQNSKNVSIKNIGIRNCWGDCIYIGGGSSNILIDSCVLDHGRRQGISITNADTVIIRKCIISNVNGVPPEYAIDIEPNKGDSVGCVLIDKVNVNNCVGGFLSTTWNRSAGIKIGMIKISNCKVRTMGKIPMRITCCRYVELKANRIIAPKQTPAIFGQDNENFLVVNNIIRQSREEISNVNDFAMSFFCGKSFKEIEINNCERVIMETEK